MEIDIDDKNIFSKASIFDQNMQISEFQQQPVEHGLTSDHMDKNNSLKDQNKISKQQLKLLQGTSASIDAHWFARNSESERKSQTYNPNEISSTTSSKYSSKIINQHNKMIIINDKEGTSPQHWEYVLNYMNAFPPLSNKHVAKQTIKKLLHQSTRSTINTNIYPSVKAASKNTAHKSYKSNSPQNISKINGAYCTPADESYNSVWTPFL